MNLDSSGRRLEEEEDDEFKMKFKVTVDKHTDNFIEFALHFDTPREVSAGNNRDVLKIYISNP